jgi:hypothetical protein
MEKEKGPTAERGEPVGPERENAVETLLIKEA